MSDNLDYSALYIILKAGLRPRQTKAMIFHYCHGLTLDECGQLIKEIPITRQATNSLIRTALHHMRANPTLRRFLYKKQSIPHTFNRRILNKLYWRAILTEMSFHCSITRCIRQSRKAHDVAGYNIERTCPYKDNVCSYNHPSQRQVGESNRSLEKHVHVSNVSTPQPVAVQ